MTSIGEKIRTQRLLKNYSQEYMAWALSLSQAAYSNIERGATDITVTRVYEIAEILEISAYLIMPKPKYGSILDYRLVESYVKIKRVFISLIRRSTSAPDKYIQNTHSDT